MANRVFEDRLGLWLAESDTPEHFTSKVTARRDAIKAFAGGMIRDVFFPRQARPEDLQLYRAVGLYTHLWVAPGAGMSAQDVANRTLLDYNRLSPGAVELDIELPSDPSLAAYVCEVVTLIRSKRKNLRLRINLAPYKGFAIPADLLQSDPYLYACEQTYYGDMSRVSEGEAYADLLAHGVPPNKLTLCYGAAALTPMLVDGANAVRVVGLPTIWTWSSGAVVRTLNRGVIFQDDLMAEVGLL